MATGFTVGSQHRAILSGAKPYKIHILAIVDEEQIVYRWFGRHKQRWNYSVEHRDFLEIMIAKA